MNTTTRIIIPAYNEEKNIEKCLLDVSKEMKKTKRKYLICVVNDGSKDKTAEIVSSLKKSIPIKLLNHKVNLGPSEAFRTGLVECAKNSGINDNIIIMEADRTSSPKLLPNIINELDKGSDVVICSRFVKGGKYHNFPPKRLFLSLCANLVMRIIFPIKNVKDYTIFYRGYKAEIVKKLVSKYRSKFITTKHYVANSEILIKLSKLTNNIKEIPFIYNYGNKKNPSAMKIVSNIRSYFAFIKSSL